MDIGAHTDEFLHMHEAILKNIFLHETAAFGTAHQHHEQYNITMDFLIKNGYAVKYTKTSNEILNTNMKNAAIQEENNIKEATKIKNELEKKEITFNVKSGKDGRTFGTISTKQIAEKLKDSERRLSDLAIEELKESKIKILSDDEEVEE